MPKLNLFSRKDEAYPLASVSDAHERELILGNIKAIEGFVLFASIAMGTLQLVALGGESENAQKDPVLADRVPKVSIGGHGDVLCPKNI